MHGGCGSGRFPLSHANFEFSPRTECVCGASVGGSPDVLKKLPQGSVGFRRCPDCGSYVQSPALTMRSLSAWYDSAEYQGGAGVRGVGYSDYAGDEQQRRIEARRRYARDLAPYLGQGARVLEVGAATGSLLAELREQGHAPLGCDLSERFAAQAHKWYGLQVAVGDWLDLQVADGSLDGIVLLGTISNLSDLDGCLRRARAQLKPSGFLFFNFPAADSVLARLYGDSYWMFTPSVMQFMTRRGMTAALKRAGFGIDRQGIDRQSPTFAKLAGHARLGFVHPLLKRLRLADTALPMSLPLPGIVAVRARPLNDGPAN